MYFLKSAVIFSLIFLSASCGLFSSKPAVSGMIKSIDGGRTYNFINVVEGSTVSLQSANISRMRFSKNDPSIIYAGSFNAGLVKSINSGESFKSVLATLSVYDFVFDPSDENIIYACGASGGNGKIVRTVDGGLTWDTIRTESVDGTICRSIVFGGRGELYAVISDGQMIVSPDKGATWKKAYNFTNKVNRLEFFDGKLFAVVSSVGVFTSTDFANNFSNITQSVKSGQVRAFVSSDAVKAFNQIFIADSGKIFLTTNLGLYVAESVGADFVRLDIPSSKNIQYYGVATSKQGETIYLGGSNNVYVSSDGGRLWYSYNIKTSGFVNQLIIDPDNKNIIYTGLFSN